MNRSSVHDSLPTDEQMNGYALLTVFIAFNAAGCTEYAGCYRDDQQKRLLDGARMELRRTQSPANCIEYCAKRSYLYAGLEFKIECFCGNRLDGGAPAAETECYYKCPGNRNRICGGDVRLSVYRTGITGPSIPPVEGDAAKGKYLGCYVDPSAESRLMKGPSREFKGTLTNGICRRHCSNSGYRYAATEFGNQCFCSNERPSFKSQTEDEDCNSRCSGDVRETCGGNLRLSLYDTSQQSSVTDRLEENPMSSQYEGCFPSGDDVEAPSSVNSDSLSVEYCIGLCYRRGFRFAKIYSADKCRCDEVLEKVPYVADTKCDTPCQGDRSQKCGGQGFKSVYSTGIPDKRAIPKRALLGCYPDSKQRLLNGPSFSGDKSLTQEKCVKYCFDRAYLLAGLQFGEECYCGDDVSGKGKAADTECQVGCQGDRTQKCGGSWRMSVFDTGLAEYRKSADNACSPSITLIDGERVCRGQVLFEDDFGSGPINKKKWHHSVYMPMAPDYPFVIYQQESSNVYVDGGNLVIKPSVMDDEKVKDGRIDLRKCTGYLNSEECVRQAVSFSILPPVESAMITTRETFSFKYGRVEIRAKLPSGDWLVPAVWLEAKSSSYGPHYRSGRLVMASARGNRVLRCGAEGAGVEELGAGVLGAGALLADDRDQPHRVMRFWRDARGWYTQFHNYTLLWTPDNISFSVDGQEKTLLAAGQKLSDILDRSKSAPPSWASSTTPVAPFDDDFYISLGVYAGGMTDFPDDCTSGNYTKPWRNFAVKAMGNFWRAKNAWFNSWDVESTLKVDYVKVTAL